MANAADKIKALNLLDLRRAARRRVGKGRRLGRPPRILFPTLAERTYTKSLKFMVAQMRQAVESRVIPALEQVMAQAQAHRPTADARLDNYGDAIANLLELTRSDFFGQWSDAEIAAMVRRVAGAVEEKNGAEIGKVFNSVLGVDLFKAEPWLRDEGAAFVTANVALIKTMQRDYFSRIESTVFNAARSGTSWRDVAASLRAGPFDAARSRAELIARDQVGKFNGQLAELRQTQAGVDRYTWRTSRDARVRDTHKHMEGKVCEWSDPPDVGGRALHPGQDYQCRCWAEPVLDDLVDGIE